MVQASTLRGADAARYADPLSVPALAWSLRQGDHAERWLWHAGALYRYVGGVYRRDGEAWAADRLRTIVLDAAERMATEARERGERQGAAWEKTCAALELLTRTIPTGVTKALREAAKDAGFWPTAAKTRQDVEARYTLRGLVEPVVSSLTADVRNGTEGAAVDGDLDTLNLANGLLDLRTLTLLPHDPDHLSTIQLPTPYDPGADCQRFGRYLSEVLPEDAIQVVEEMMGYLLTADTRHHTAFLLLGGGSNGKSLLLDVLRAMLGPENCSATALQSLGEDKWAPASLLGKLANLCADLPAATQRDTSKFKEIAAGDTMNAEEKYHASFSFRPFARLVFSANEAPGTADASHGYWRRWLTIPFPHKFAKATDAAALAEGARPVDDGLRATLLAELPGILNIALVGLLRLRGQGGFTHSPSCEQALQQYRERADSVAAFVAEACDLAPGCTSARTTLYVAYREWCVESGREPLGRNRFCERIDATAGVTEERDEARARCWGGIRLRPHEVPMRNPRPAGGWGG